jgi:C-methyltransferase
MQQLKTRQDAYDLMFAAAASAALGTAVETGLLWLLAEEPLDGAGVAQALHIPSRRCFYWLQLLASLGILDWIPGGYVTSQLARDAFLDSRSQDSWQHLAIDERERSAGVHNLARYISEPGSVWKAQGLTEPRDYVEKMARSLDRAREFTRMLYEVHQRLGEELAAYLDMTGVQRLMDAGGNSGVVSMALLRQHAELLATVVDIENVCIAGREIADETGLADRIAYLALDLRHDDLPAGFDMVLLCDVGLFGEALFRRLLSSLNPGGRLVIVNHFASAEDAAPTSRLVWTFIDSLEDPDFSIPTIAQVRADLVQAGFKPLPGERTLFDQRVVIQAQK